MHRSGYKDENDCFTFHLLRNSEPAKESDHKMHHNDRTPAGTLKFILDPFAIYMHNDTDVDSHSVHNWHASLKNLLAHLSIVPSMSKESY